MQQTVREYLTNEFEQKCEESIREWAANELELASRKAPQLVLDTPQKLENWFSDSNLDY